MKAAKVKLTLKGKDLLKAKENETEKVEGGGHVLAISDDGPLGQNAAQAIKDELKRTDDFR